MMIEFAVGVLTLSWGCFGCILIAVCVAQNITNHRSYKLLHEWLSPRQRMEIKTFGGFTVKGRSGFKYVIRKRRPFNIMAISPDGDTFYMCMEPEGSLAGGDVLLAQKIMLETNEHEAVIIANFRDKSWY